MDSFLIIIAHAGESGSLLERYLEILTDPAHFLAELTFTLIDLILLSPILFHLYSKFKSFFKLLVHREHLAIDEEHGFKHREKDSV